MERDLFHLVKRRKLSYCDHVMRKERRLFGDGDYARHCSGSKKARKTKDAMD